METEPADAESISTVAMTAAPQSLLEPGEPKPAAPRISLQLVTSRIVRGHLADNGRALIVAGAGVWGAGLSLRIWLMAVHPQAFLGFPDSAGYIAAAQGSLFGSAPMQPPGYPLFLRTAHTVSAQLVWTVAVQHALGLATAGLYWLIVRRLSGAAWAGLVVVAVVLMDGTQLFFEHAVLSEVLVVWLIALGVYAALRANGERSWVWAGVSGACFGYASVVRLAALPLIAIVALWLLFDRRRSLRPGRALVAAGVGVAVAGMFVIGQHESSGIWGFTRSDGFNLYLRASSFADCSQFHPPRGTRVLCARGRPPRARDRPGPYHWACPVAPGLCQFGNPPDASSKLGAFAIQAIVHQPLDYLGAVGRDFAKYIAPPAGASTNDLLRILDSPIWETTVTPVATRYYTTPRTPTPSPATVDAYAHAIRIEGPALAVLIAGALVSLLLAGSDARRGALLLCAVGLTLLVVPVATAHYEPRFGLPPTAPLAAASALALTGAVARIRTRCQPRVAQPAD